MTPAFGNEQMDAAFSLEMISIGILLTMTGRDDLDVGSVEQDHGPHVAWNHGNHRGNEAGWTCSCDFVSFLGFLSFFPFLFPFQKKKKK